LIALRARCDMYAATCTWRPARGDLRVVICVQATGGIPA
jgi:hypothetical protein